MESKNSFLIYTSWRSFFELLEEPELIKELLYTMFDIAEGKETAVTSSLPRLSSSGERKVAV